MSKVSALYHIVINTKNREMIIPEEHKRDLYRYIYGIIINHSCTLIRMNGISNHIHMLVDLNPTVALSDLMQSLKQSSSRWMKSNEHFPHFKGWGKEYFAFSVSQSGKDRVVEYIKNQEEHHYASSHSFDDEIQAICKLHDIDWNPGALT